MKTIVLDDDPTGTQSATGVSVLLETNVDLLVDALRQADSVYVQTNSRALPEAEAVALVAKIKADGEAATSVWTTRSASCCAATRRYAVTCSLSPKSFSTTTRSSSSSPRSLRAAAPPAEAFTTSASATRSCLLTRASTRKTRCSASRPQSWSTMSRRSRAVSVFRSRSNRSAPGALVQVLAGAPAGSVVLPDVVDADDVFAVARAVNEVTARGRRVVVRCAAPLAAELAGVPSRGLLPAPLLDRPARVLLVCGSHTLGASAQLAPIAEAWGLRSSSTPRRPLDPAVAGFEAADGTLAFDGSPVIVLATERVRSTEHNTLAHGERVMPPLRPLSRPS